MKKIILLVACAAMFSACANVYSTYADITWMDNNGKVVQKFDNAYIGSAVERESISNVFKVSGLNFTDCNGEDTFISGGMIYCKFKTENTGKYNEVTGKITKKVKNIEGQLAILRDTEDSIVKEMSKHDKKSLEYKTLNDELKAIRKKITDLEIQRGF